MAQPPGHRGEIGATFDAHRCEEVTKIVVGQLFDSHLLVDQGGVVELPLLMLDGILDRHPVFRVRHKPGSFSRFLEDRPDPLLCDLKPFASGRLPDLLAV